MKTHSQNEQPRTLLFDIETAPNIGAIWGKWQQDVLWFQSEWYIISFAYMWLDEGVVRVMALPDMPSYKRDKSDDRALVRQLWQLFNQADIIIAHNGDEFDIKKARTRFVYHRLQPPKPSRSIDTLKIARSQFGFTSNSLNDLAEFLGIGVKEDTGGKKLWRDCAEFDIAKAWGKMKKYNKRDVWLLWQVYLRLRPWAKNHPNFGMWSDDMVCPTCKADALVKEGLIRKQTTIYQQFSCKECGGWSRAVLNLREKDREALTVST